ncbi:MAG: M1 family metallopeptidase [Myxococcales bacterium]|nr:M1 family metallopeptidase [Myxococcales bacterium]
MTIVPVALAALVGGAPLRLPGPLSPRNASYRITARLDERAHKVSGQLLLSWRNLERYPVRELVFHLYLNAFKNRASTFIREVGPQLRGDKMPEGGYGAIDVTALRVGRHDLLAQARLDDTLLTVPLPEPVGPSAAVQVEMDFVATLPKVFARSGYAGPFHAVAQWFPKIGVWDCRPSCRWRAHPYHGQTEFFADYGVYEVELDVPADMIVGATGVLEAERSEGGRRHLRFRAEDVHDFAWMADPRFVEVWDELHDAWGVVSLRLLTRPGSLGMNERHLQAVRQGLLELQRRFGPYPYSQLTIVVPPPDGSGAGGMEYPTLFATISGEAPRWLAFHDEVTLHELGHQYFYGILGTDEVEEAWLDEGLNQAFTTWAVERLRGPRCNIIRLPGLCLSQLDLEWLAARQAQRRMPIATPGFLFPPDSYGALTYSQTALVLRTLERHLGPARMEAGLRRYAERHRFGHPRGDDFMAAVNEGAGEDLRWFWDQALLSSRTADYAVLSATSTPHEPAYGLWDCPPRPPTAEDPAVRALIEESQRQACAGKPPGRHLMLPSRPARPDGPHDSQVWLQRRGELIFPVAVRLSFADGSTIVERWSLQEQQREPERRVRRFSYTGRPALRSVVVDPDQTLLLDERRLNNGLLLQPDPAPARRLWVSWLGLLQTVVDLLRA